MWPVLAVLIGDAGRELGLAVCGTHAVVGSLAVRREAYCWAGMGI